MPDLRIAARELRRAPIVTASPSSRSRSASARTPPSPLAQVDFPVPPSIDGVVSVRASTVSPMLLARSIAATLTAVDRDLVFGFRSMTDQVSASLTQERLVAILSGFFGVLALLLAGLGLYGITAYGVACRRAEIGIRMALGSTGTGVVRLVVSRTAWLVAAGILIGAGTSAWASKFVATLLYGLDPGDPLTLVGATVTLALVGIAAAWLPATGQGEEAAVRAPRCRDQNVRVEKDPVTHTCDGWS